MTRIHRPLLTCLLLSALTLPLLSAERPNIVFVLADDLGWGDPQCYNPASKINTPAIDRLAAEGLRLTDMHSPSAVCSPTRYGLLTGRYAWRSRLKSGVLWGWSPPLIETNRLTLPALLKGKGYATAGFGKWHLGLGWVTRQPAQFGDASKPASDPALVDYTRPLWGGPHTAGFDHYFGIPASLDMEPYLFIENNRCVEPPTSHTAGDKHQRQGGNGFYRPGPIAPSFKVEEVLPEITRRAVQYIEHHAAQYRAQPFFVYLPLSAPHDPWLPTQPFRGRSTSGPRGDFVAQTDASLGQVLDALDRLGLAKRTLVVFTSDNGAHWLADEIGRTDHHANGPWRGQKSDAHEAGHRVPCVIRWPGKIKPGATNDRPLCLVDFMATFAEITGARLPLNAAEDSFSFASLLTGKRPRSPARESLVSHSGNGVFALRRDGWKLIDGLGSGGFTNPVKLEPEPDGPKGQLYDLNSDPAETHNLYLTQPGRVAQLRRELEQLRSANRSRPIP